MGRGSKTWCCACGGDLDWNPSKGKAFGWEHRDMRKQKGAQEMRNPTVKAAA